MRISYAWPPLTQELIDDVVIRTSIADGLLRKKINMPYTVERRGDKFRLIRADTGRIATNSSGTAIDGGGHATRAEAEAQMRAVEMHDHKSFLRVERR